MKPVYNYNTIKDAVEYCRTGEWIKKSNPKLDTLLQDNVFKDYILASVRCLQAKEELSNIEEQYWDALVRYKGFLKDEENCRKRIQVSLFPENFFEKLLEEGK